MGELPTLYQEAYMEQLETAQEAALATGDYTPKPGGGYYYRDPTPLPPPYLAPVAPDPWLPTIPSNSDLFFTASDKVPYATGRGPVDLVIMGKTTKQWVDMGEEYVVKIEDLLNAIDIDIYNRVGPFIRTAANGWKLGGEVVDIWAKTVDWCADRPWWQDYIPIYGWITSAIGSLDNPLEFLNVIPNPTWIVPGNNPLMDYEHVGHIIGSMWDEAAHADPATVLDIWFPPDARRLLENIGVFEPINSVLKTKYGQIFSDVLEVASIFAGGGGVVGIGGKAIITRVAKLFAKKVTPWIAAGGLTTYFLQSSVRNAIDSGAELQAGMADTILEMTEFMMKQSQALTDAIKDTKDTPIITSAEPEVVESIPEPDLEPTPVTPKPEPDEPKPELKEEEEPVDEKVTDETPTDASLEKDGMDWWAMMRAVGAMMTGVGTLTDDDKVIDTPVKGGGGSGPGGLNCPLIVKKAIEAKDLSSVPPECYAFLEKVKSKASKGVVNGRNDRGRKTSKRFSGGSRNWERSGREDALLELGSPGLDTLWT
jgi:hypothetical protein